MTNEQNNAVVTTDSQMPCPFCDGQAAVCISSTHRNGTFVYCLSCVASGHDFETKEEAITAWNTRQPTAVSSLVLLRAIEQHEAFKQEVSDIVYAHVNATNETMNDAWEKLKTLIIPKPKPKSDPLVEVIAGWTGGTVLLASDLRAALDARGLEIREKGQ
jgi:Lar family restriction alleviation protein